MHGVQLRKPVKPGMRLTGTATVVDQELRYNGTGIVACRGELRDDSGDLVLCLTGEFVLRRQLGGSSAGR